MPRIKIDIDLSPFSSDEISQINNILQTTGLMGEGDSIESNSDAPAPASSELEPQSWWTKVRGGVCRAGCATAASAAAAACTGLSSGTAVAACLAAAAAAEEVCRNECPS